LQPSTVYRIKHTLPAIRSGSFAAGGHRITIEGNGATIKAMPGAAPMGFFVVAGSFVPSSHTPVLKLNNLKLSGARGSAISVVRGKLFMNGSSISRSRRGITVNADADLFMRASTIANNKVEGITANSNALLVLNNSTISNNGWPGLNIGGSAKLKMTDSTISGNGGRGLLLHSRYYQPEISRSIIAGNGRKLGNNVNREIFQVNTALRWKGGDNLIGYNGQSGAAGSDLAVTDIVPQIPLNQLILPLAANGGFVQTHALPEGSPALALR
jgi:hypothetical protein